MEDLRLVKQVDPEPLAEELHNFLKFQKWGVSRAKYNLVQRETYSLTIVAPDKKFERVGDKFSFHTQVSVETSIAKYFATTLLFVKKTADENKSTLGRVLIVNLPPNREVYPHTDYGDYYKIRNRYHLVLSSGGSTMVSNENEKIFKKGDLFYINNKKIHSARNSSSEERVHLIFDLLPKNLSSRLFVLASISRTLVTNMLGKIIFIRRYVKASSRDDEERKFLEKTF